MGGGGSLPEMGREEAGNKRYMPILPGNDPGTLGGCSGLWPKPL